jgi:hypothetical protein
LLPKEARPRPKGADPLLLGQLVQVPDEVRRPVARPACAVPRPMVCWGKRWFYRLSLTP